MIYASVNTPHKPHATLIRILSDIHDNLRQSKYEDSAAVAVRVAADDDDDAVALPIDEAARRQATSKESI